METIASLICVYNNPVILKECLIESSQNQDTKFEWVLIDNTQGKFRSAAEALNWGGDIAKGNI